MNLSDYHKFLGQKLRPEIPSGIDPKEMPSCLFEWQEIVARLALRRGRFALFEDCGLGKTLQQIAWAWKVVEHTNKPVIIISPLGVSYQTVREGDKFDLPVLRINHHSEVRSPMVYVMNYEKVRRHLKPDFFAGVVLDESSILKDVGGKLRKWLTDAFVNTPYKLSCTATPSPNDLVELGNQCEFLGIMKRSEMLSTFFINDQKVRDAGSKWRLKGHATESFYDWLATWCIYMRKPSDVGYPDDGYILPEHRFNTIVTQFQNNTELVQMPVKGIRDLQRLRQASVQARGLTLLENIDQEKLNITWCDLNPESDHLAKIFPDAVEVKGSQKPQYKEEMLLAFADGEISHLITKRKIAGHGMHFAVCHRQQFFGLDHSAEIFYQAYRRLVRYGQKEEVNTDIYVTDRDDHIVSVVMNKLRKAEIAAGHVVKRMGKTMQEELHHESHQIPESPLIKQSGSNWDFFFGDSCELIKQQEDNSVHFQIMSPPFPELYTYSDSPRDIGNSDWQTFWDHWNFMIPEMLRVALPGRLCSIHCMEIPIKKQEYGYIGLRDFPGEIIRAFVNAGWIFFDRRTIWKDPIVENARSHSMGHGNLLKDSTKSRTGLCDYMLTFLKPGENKIPVLQDDRNFPVLQWQKWASGAYTQREAHGHEIEWLKEPPDWMRSLVWYDIRQSETLQKDSAREERDEKHICPLQLTAIRRFILMYSNPGELVASWFGGIGSEGYVAVKEGRRALLCELKKSYWQQGIKNLEAAENFAAQTSLPFEIL